MNKTILQSMVICAASVFAAACADGRTEKAGSGDNMAAELRNMILSSEVPAANDSDRNPSVVVMDVHVGDEIASVMTSSGGDASIYFSSGGAKIGGVGHANVRAAAVAFANTALKYKSAMAPATAFPYPPAGKVRFYLRTRDGVVSVEAPERDLAAGTHELSELFRAGQEVITQFRSVGD